MGRAMNGKLAYLRRAFSRLCEEAVQSAQKGRLRVMAEATSRGALQSGGSLISVKGEYDRVANETTDKMVRLAFDVTGDTSEPTCAVVEEGLTALRDALSNDLAQFYSAQTWARSNAPEALRSDFHRAMDKRTTGTIDDFRHGIVGGTRLTKDPLVNVISTITNSPGAVLQSGTGNVQAALTSVESNDIRSALTQFMASKEVQALTGENKQSLSDVAEVISDELDKQQPDASKLRRWGKRLIDVAERIGVGVATSGLARILFG